MTSKFLTDQRYREDRHSISQRRPIPLNSTLNSRVPRLLLGLRELDTALRGPLVVIGRAKVAAAVGHPVAVRQELLLVAEVGLKRIRLLLRVERAYLLPWGGGSIEAAQRQLPWPG